MRRMWQARWTGRAIAGHRPVHLAAPGSRRLRDPAGLRRHRARVGVDALLGAFVGGVVLNLADSDDSAHPGADQGKLHAIGYGFLVPVFFIVTGVQFDLEVAVRSGPSSLVLVPPSWGRSFSSSPGRCPALLYRGAARRHQACDRGRATAGHNADVPGRGGRSRREPRPAVRPAAAAALVGAALPSVLIFPAVALALRPWTPAAMPDRDPHVVNM